MKEAIIFYCKHCGGWLFCCQKTEQIIKDSEKEIIQLLAENHKIEEIDYDKTELTVDPCKCNPEIENCDR